MSKTYVKWSDVEIYIIDLAEALRKDKDFDLDACPGIFTFPRGGLVLAVMLSHELGKPILANPQKGCIIIDDIVDSGITMKKYSDEAKEKGYYITSMFLDEAQQNGAEYQCQVKYYQFVKRGDWIVYPWEKD